MMHHALRPLLLVVKVSAFIESCGVYLGLFPLHAAIST